MSPERVYLSGDISIILIEGTLFNGRTLITTKRSHLNICQLYPIGPSGLIKELG